MGGNKKTFPFKRKSKAVWLLTSQAASTLLQVLNVSCGTLHCSGAPGVVDAWHMSDRGPHCEEKKHKSYQ